MKQQYTISSLQKSILPSVTHTDTLSVFKLGAFFAKSYRLLAQTLPKTDLEHFVPFACYKDFDFCHANKKRHFLGRLGYMLKARWKVSAGIEYTKELTEVASPLEKEPGYTGVFLKTVHHGAYRKVEHAYKALFEYAQAHQLKTGNRAYEFYLNDPRKVKTQELRTEVYMEIN